MKLLIFLWVFSLNVFADSNSIIAVVNNDLITFDAIREQLQPNQNKQQKLALLNQQIDLVLQLQKAQRIGIKPELSSINEVLNMTAINNKLTSEQLQSLPQFNQIFNRIEQQLMLGELEQFVLKNIKFELTEDEINAGQTHVNENFSQQVKIAQIVINAVDNNGSLIQPKAQLIKDFLLDLSVKIKNGQSFSALAKLHSQDASYKNGGESGWIDVDKLPNVFKKNLKFEKLSKPFETPQGWRIAKIIDRRQVDNNLINLKNKLIRQKRVAYFKNWVKKLRKNAYIEIFEHKL